MHLILHVSRIVVGILFVVLPLAFSAAQVAADTVIGKWAGTWEAQYGRAGWHSSGDVVLEISSTTDGSVTGILDIRSNRTQHPITGKLSGDVITFTYVSSRATQHDFALKLSGDKLAGRLKLSGIGISPGDGGSASFTRQP